MQTELFLIGILPLILFVIVEIKAGLKAGVWTAIITALLAAGYFSWKVGKVDPMMATEVGLIVLLGLVSLKFLNDRFIKFQPVVMALAFSIYAGYLQMSGSPIFIRLGELATEFNPAIGELFEVPVFQDFLTTASLHVVFLFLAHGLLVFWGAIKLGSIGWLLTRLAFYPMVFIFMAIEMAIHPQVASTLGQMLKMP